MATNNSTHSPEEIKTALRRFSEHLYARKGYADATVELVTGFARRFTKVIGLNPSHEEIEGYLAHLRVSKLSYGNIANSITALERYAEFIGNPIVLKRPTKPRQVFTGLLSEADIVRIIAASKDIRQRAILSLLAYAGLRNRELIGLKVRNIEIGTQMVVIENGKGGAHRRACIVGPCCEVLNEYLENPKRDPDDFLFVTVRNGTPLQTQDLRKMIHVAAKRANITKRVYPHLFRHSLATNLLHRGANLLTIRDQMGHSNINSTMIYLHVAKERLHADLRQFMPSYM